MVNQQAETNVKIEDSTKKEIIEMKPKPLMAIDNQPSDNVTIVKETIGKKDEAIDIKSKA